jgi:hypothetical protein
MKFSNRNPTAWRRFGSLLTAITAMFAGGFVIEGSELAADGWTFLGWQYLCFIPLTVGLVACLARSYWLDGRLTRHSMELEPHILLPSIAVIGIGALLVYSGCVFDARFALSRDAFERAVQAGVTFESDGYDRWVGLYRVRGLRVDRLGRTAFNLGDCSMFAHCELEFDATTPCHSRGWREYAAVDAHWCLVIHNHL